LFCGVDMTKRSSLCIIALLSFFSCQAGAQSAVEYPKVPITNLEQRQLSDEHDAKYRLFEQKDANGDGGIDLAEYHRMDWHYRTRYDLDRNELLTWPEFILAACPVPRENILTKVNQICLREHKKTFAGLDINKDQSISFEEALPIAKRFFDGNDRCRDGRLKRNEARC
jgi:hypothetical protein